MATTTESIEELLEKFWRVESCEDHPAWSKEEQDCEEHIRATHSRSEEGRYVIQLPKCVNWDHMLGESRVTALNRYRKLENRLEHDINMKEQYHAFMKEYLAMGHMRLLTQAEQLEESKGLERPRVYYLPHHAVVKESSFTTRVRVVFDASARTDSGYSLNNILLKGPQIQDDLFILLIRFRKHEVALVGDVEKMYRQILLDTKDILRLRIFLRFTKDGPIDVYELLTVTYGLTPSSFLATRALQQLAEDEGKEGTKSRSALLKDLYVDDYIGGASTVDEAIELRKDLTSLMAKGGFPIRKWCSNRPEVLSGIPEDQLGTILTIKFELNPEEKVQTLGITWKPKADQLKFCYQVGAYEGKWTRRRILSIIAKLFDPPA
ncbi:uncharacterized protein LOC129721560 isoform X1 [Wyeomyia smithii]|uniref:uncharacterized protein LOC129721560 isoform X1 n=1 Tax=Wyeomyia smithii TaxID=174621 RepID=UPI002467CC52|nr:uncharacterized protein LOC129721560 isoform X1 [Wyeomyia smithii]